MKLRMGKVPGSKSAAAAGIVPTAAARLLSET